MLPLEMHAVSSVCSPSDQTIMLDHLPYNVFLQAIFELCKTVISVAHGHFLDFH